MMLVQVKTKSGNVVWLNRNGVVLIGQATDPTGNLIVGSTNIHMQGGVVVTVESSPQDVVALLEFPRSGEDVGS